jgi:ribonuclease D
MPDNTPRRSDGNVPPLPADDRIHLVETAAQFAAACEKIAALPILAIDTESNSLHAYKERVCVIQAGSPDEVWIIDPLSNELSQPGALARLGEIMADPSKRTLLHGSDYDVACLRRDFNISIGAMFDTEIAANLLGKPRTGLANLVEEYLGAHLPKKFKRHDWARRPLEPDHIHYLIQDVIYLEPLAAALEHEIIANELQEEFSIECVNVHRAVEARESDPAKVERDYRSVKGATDLPNDRWGVLRRIYEIRETLAEQFDAPLFKVIGDRTLVEIAIRGPRTEDELRAIGGMSSRVLAASDRLLEAVREGIASPEGAPPPPKKATRRYTPFFPSDAECMDAVQAFRRRESEKRGVSMQAVLPKRCADRLVPLRPFTEEQLMDDPDIGASRWARYGRALLAVLNEPSHARTEEEMNAPRHRRRRRGRGGESSGESAGDGGDASDAGEGE